MRTGTEEKTPLRINANMVESYLRQRFGPTARLTWLGEIGKPGEQGMKDFGYGKPLRIEYRVGGQPGQAVLSIMRGDKYGHQFYWDRAAILMFQNDASNRLPRHVKALGLGYFDRRDAMVAVMDPKEFFILSELAPGHDYYVDLERITRQGAGASDLDLVESLADWLAEVHAERVDNPDLYLRRVRDLIGASECIFGLVDSYPYPYELFGPERFVQLEKRIIDWRWKLRRYTHRLCPVHGDFHPWNTLVRQEGDALDFSVLDRSRGEFGEPADDVATMTLNYVLFGLYGQTGTPRLQGDFETMYRRFWQRYLDRTGDQEILEVIAPFYVFRGLVIASPQWYPSHPEPVRRGLFRFLHRVLEDDRFDWEGINKYLEE
ncbi:hypothetical protein JCM15519_36410 [Fundidesulfovibrio butyratiphilus]